MAWLNSFLAFNESKNIVVAAGKLRITQPALSKHLQKLEESLGNPVFVLQGRKKVLTPFGQSLYLALRERLSNIQDVITQTQAIYGNPQQALVRISARRGVLDRISPRLKFEGKLFLQEADNDKILDSLQNFNSEIGITYKVLSTYNLISKPLFHEKFLLVIPKSLGMSKPTFNISLLTKLEKLPCIGYKPNDSILVALCKYGGLNINNHRLVRTTENYEAIAEMVCAGIGWAALPSYVDMSKVKNFLLPIPAKILPERKFQLIYRAEYKSVSWFKRLIAEIESCF